MFQYLDGSISMTLTDYCPTFRQSNISIRDNRRLPKRVEREQLFRSLLVSITFILFDFVG
jgi:hypothetical protein